MTRPKRPGRRLFRILLFTVYCPLFTLLSCSFEITATRYALVYGAADYPGTANDLGVTDDDARDVSTALAAAGWIIRETRQPTVDTAQIQADIAALVGVVDPDSSVLVYFSGHGDADVFGTYIIPTDENQISASDLLSWLDSLPCRNTILILDTCYSGGFVPDTGTLDTAPQNYGVYDDGTGGYALLAALGSYSELLASAFQSYDPRTPIVVTAAGSEELSYESGTYGNGVFTYFFLEAASKGDLDGNGFVTIQEAYRYARNKLDNYWNEYVWDDEFYFGVSGIFADYLPRISGNARDVVIF